MNVNEVLQERGINGSEEIRQGTGMWEVRSILHANIWK
jgi:hypothetical protein